MKIGCAGQSLWRSMLSSWVKCPLVRFWFRTEAWNCPLKTHDPTAHAEIRALRLGGEQLTNYRLVDTTLYVTLEPCIMCIGAIVHARVKRLVFGADDPKRGAVVSALCLNKMTFLNHRLDYEQGVLSRECGQLLKSFFAQKRR